MLECVLSRVYVFKHMCLCLCLGVNERLGMSVCLCVCLGCDCLLGCFSVFGCPCDFVCLVPIAGVRELGYYYVRARLQV